jgi:hypothetical protein
MDPKSEVSSKEGITNRDTVVDASVQEFLGKILSDLGGAYSAVLVYVGDKLGLCKAIISRIHKLLFYRKEVYKYAHILHSNLTLVSIYLMETA